MVLPGPKLLEASDCPPARTLQEQRDRLLDQLGEHAEELSASRAVERAVVARERERPRGLHITLDCNEAVGDPDNRKHLH